MSITDRRLRDLASDSGTLDRPIVEGFLSVPRDIALEGDRLVWKDAGGHRAVAPNRGMLDDFVQLEDVPPAVILRYARRWGVLQLCKHGLPASHNPQRGPHDPTWMGNTEGAYEAAWCQELHLRTAPNGDPYFYEELSAWREYAGRARALLAIAAALHRGVAARPEDWFLALHNDRAFAGREVPWWKRGDTLFERALLSRVVNTWIQFGDVTFKIDWWTQLQPKVLIGGHDKSLTLFGALAAQILFAASKREGPTFCDGCGALVSSPSRRPRAGERHYCDECRETGVPRRAAAAAWREREKLKAKKRQR